MENIADRQEKNNLLTDKAILIKKLGCVFIAPNWNENWKDEGEEEVANEFGLQSAKVLHITLYI